jgi:hypothetical protein
MRAAIIPLALAACFEAAQGFSPAAVGLTRSSALPSARAMSGMRGGSGLVAAQMATAHDFKLPLVGERPPLSPRGSCAPRGRPSRRSVRGC